MTLKEAQERKSTIGDSFTHEGIEYKVTIVPKREKDFEDFISSYLDVTDKLELAKGCSVNQEYNIYGMWTDGINILKKNVQ